MLILTYYLIDHQGVVVISSTSLAVGETEVHTTSTRTGGFSWISTNEFISSSDDGGIHWRRFSRNVEKSEEISMIKVLDVNKLIDNLSIQSLI